MLERAQFCQSGPPSALGLDNSPGCSRWAWLQLSSFCDNISACILHCTHVCMDLDAPQGSAWITLFLTMTGIITLNIRVLAAGRKACWQLGKLMCILVKSYLLCSGELEWIPTECSNAFSHKASVITAVNQCDCAQWETSLRHSLIHGHASLFRLPGHSHHHPPINAGWWWLH